MSGRKFRIASALLVGMLLFAGVASAQTAPGLGTNWPNAHDVSTNPQYHVYRWVQGNITYLQVNDIAGNVKFAVGTVNGVAFVLPVGAPQMVQVQPAAAPSATASSLTSPSASTVYSDPTITVQQTNSTFSVTPSTQMVCKDPADCSGG
jgi:hypothetical protein